jgi:aryl-alcohol dehydrogenase-like predicted oxidoreductase
MGKIARSKGASAREKVMVEASMQFARIPGVARPLSRIVLGTLPLTEVTGSVVFDLLDTYVGLNGNAFESARHYGEAERILGAWMRERRNREQMVLITKGAHPDSSGRARVGEAAIAADLAASLEALDTESIDLYLLHRDDPDVPAGDVVEWLNEHSHAGRIDAFGGSNWPTARLEEANTYARTHGLVPFAAGSPNLSLATMLAPPWTGCISAGPEDRAWYTAHQLPLVAWSVQAQGFFTGRYGPDRKENTNMVRCWYSEENFARRARAEELGTQLDVPATAIAVAYVLAQPFPTFAVIGPRSIEELRESMTAARAQLSPEQVSWLEHGG